MIWKVVSVQKPTLRRYSDLKATDFEAFPVWLGAYGLDQELPWASEIDEVTYKPWEGSLPYSSDPRITDILVRADFRMADGTIHVGFATPPYQALGERGFDLGTVQPSIFLPNGNSVGFWRGRLPSRLEKQEFYGALQRGPDQVFPIRLVLSGKFIQPAFECVVAGFCTLGPDRQRILVEV